LLAAFIIIIGLAAWFAFEVGDETTAGKTKLDKLRNSAAVISAGASLSIPVVIFIAGYNFQSATIAQTKEAEAQRYAQTKETEAQRHKQTKETETLRIMNDVDVRITEITATKEALDNSNKKKQPEKEWSKEKSFSYDYIVNDTAVYNEVRKLLNAYEFVCVGVNKGLLERDVVKKMRMDALVLTFRLDYRRYINRIHEDFRNVDTWSDCVKLATELEPEVAARSRTLAVEFKKLEEEEKNKQTETPSEKPGATK
jgi:hypothetical protein